MNRITTFLKGCKSAILFLLQKIKLFSAWLYAEAKPFITKRNVLLIFFLVFAFSLGWFCHRATHPAQTVHSHSETTQVKEIKVPIKSDTKTEIRYIEKSSVEDSDVSIHSEKPQVVVDYNGQQTKFDTLSNETQKFEKGKLSVDQTSRVTLDVTPIVKREVDTAVAQNTKEITEKKDKEITQLKKDDSKKRKKNIVESFLAGAAVGVVVGVLK